MVVSGVGYILWHGCQTGLVIDWSFPKFLLYLYFCTSYRQYKLYIEAFVAGLVFQYLHWWLCLVTGDSLYILYSLLLGALAWVTLTDAWVFPLSYVSILS